MKMEIFLKNLLKSISESVVSHYYNIDDNVSHRSFFRDAIIFVT